VRALSLASLSFLAALENDRAGFRKKFDAPAITPLVFPLDLEESLLFIACICGDGDGGRESGVDLGVLDLDLDLVGPGEEEAEEERRGEKTLNVGVDAVELGVEFEFESVDDDEGSGIGIGLVGGGEPAAAGEGDEAGEEDWRLESGLYLDILSLIYVLCWGYNLGARGRATMALYNRSKSPQLCR